MINYIINKNTYAIIATYNGSRIIEKDKDILTEKYPKDIISYNCKYYGSSLLGRLEGTKELININYKSPIIISEYKSIVMFPTTSIREDYCSWICQDYILNVKKENNNTLITFKNDEKIIFDVSKNIINNQILKSSRLKLINIERNLY